ncbi:hypothetical protein [Cryptosporangium phraense]|uniref:Uncharacterized protein n=1 Tax=Cryptosporangium phraense TaxID=2593070 RepID=A0A545AWB6_9ACTN|nr:hypothetical protein [Cryptosporangium phraense]TQS45622.1 hypothetical protein FL583_07805 [Cryptosporangium phraense]
MDEREELRQELRRLCRGRGVLAPDLAQRVGPRVAALVSDAGDRSAIVDWLRDHVRRLPGDLRLAAAVGLGLHPPADARFLGERLDWLATDLGREQRTVRRRLDEALALLAEAVTGSATPPAETADPSGTGWYNHSVRSLVMLDRDDPEVFEERTIAATGAPIDVIRVAISVPRQPDGEPPDLFVDVLYGGLLLSSERPSTSHFRSEIALPRTVGPDDAHRVGFRYRLAPGQRMAPHYALTPLSRCDRFALRVRFPIPTPTTYLLRGVPPRSLDDPPGALTRVEPDRAGEATARFEALTPGLGYGLRWV